MSIKNEWLTLCRKDDRDVTEVLQLYHGVLIRTTVRYLETMSVSLVFIPETNAQSLLDRP